MFILFIFLSSTQWAPPQKKRQVQKILGEEICTPLHPQVTPVGRELYFLAAGYKVTTLNPKTDGLPIVAVGPAVHLLLLLAVSTTEVM